MYYECLVCMHACIHITCESEVHGVQMGAPECLELEKQTVVSCVGAGSGAQAHCTSSSPLLNSLSRSVFLFFMHPLCFLMLL